MWLLTAFMLLFLWLIASLRMPQTDVSSGGILEPSDAAASTVASLLADDFSENVSFTVYDEEESLHRDIEAGRITCGFVFADDFGAKMQALNLRHGVTCIESPFSVGTEVLKEAVFAAIFREYGNVILASKEPQIFASDDPSRMERIYEKREEYLSDDQLFTPKEVFVETTVPAGNDMTDVSQLDNAGTLTGQGGSLWGIYYMCLFLMMLGTIVTEEQNAKRGLLGALPPRDALFYRISSEVTSILIPAIAGFCFLAYFRSDGGIACEGLHFILFVVYACIWIEAIGRMLMRHDLGSKLVSLLAAHLLLLPILTDLSSIVPAVRFLRFLLPAAVYLI